MKYIKIFLFLVIFLLAYAQIVYASNASNSATQDFSIAQSYFSDILNGQLIIFSVIVGALVGLQWLYQRSVNKSEIKKEVENVIKETKKDLEKLITDQFTSLEKKIAKDIQKGDMNIKGLRGEVYRSVAQFWDSQKTYPVSFAWWIRAASYFAQVEDEPLTRICLGSAKNSVENIQYGFEIDADTSGEAQRLLSDIDDKLYKIEKDLLYEAIKATLQKKFQTNTQ